MSKGLRLKCARHGGDDGLTVFPQGEILRFEVEYEDQKHPQGLVESLFCWIDVDDAIELHAYLGAWIEEMKPTTEEE